MINNDLLSNRLNLFKQGGPSKKNDSSLLPFNLDIPFLTIILTGFFLVARILMYGYATRLIVKADWNFFNTILIGLTITVLLTYISDLIHPKV